jgi:hypothetical protein
MSIYFACPVCKTAYTVADRDAGKKSDCKACGQRLQVPSPKRLKTVLGEELPPRTVLGEELASPPELAPLPPNPVGAAPAPAASDARQPESESPERQPPPEHEPEPEPRGPSRRWWREDDSDDECPRRPGKAQAIAFIVLIGGGWAGLWALGLVVLSFCYCLAWPGTYYALVFAILACIRGAELMGDGAGSRRSPRSILVMQILTAVNFDVVNLAGGIVGFVFLNDPALERYYSRGRRYE